MNDDNNGKKPKMTLGAGLLLVFFFGCMAGILVFSQSNPRYSIVCMGAMFLVMGLFALVSSGLRKENAMLLIFPVVGAGMIIIPLVLQYQENNPGQAPILTEKTIASLVPLVFFFVGTGIFARGAAKLVHRKTLCTEAVEATCIDLQITRSSKGTQLYRPVWEYYYHGESHVHADSAATNVGVPNLGDTCTLMINPDDPEDLYRKGDPSMLIFLIFGAVFIAVSLLIMYAMSQVAFA